MQNDEHDIEFNKNVVRRFNRDVIERGDRRAFEALIADDFINRTVAPGVSPGADGMWSTFEQVLRPALADLRVQIHEQVAERDLVTTRKTISGIHRGPFAGIAATGQHVSIEVIDMIRIRQGRYVEHWGMNTLAAALGSLRQAAPPR